VYKWASIQECWNNQRSVSISTSLFFELAETPYWCGEIGSFNYHDVGSILVEVVNMKF
jgi:hypothetical protein